MLVTRVRIPFEMSGPVAVDSGLERLGAEAELTVNRFDYGSSWNGVMETGGVIVGEDIRIELSVSAMRSTEP